MIGALTHFLPNDGMLKTLLRSGTALASKDVETIARILIDMEMKMFQGLRTPVIFIQNVFTDLLLGIGIHGQCSVSSTTISWKSTGPSRDISR